MSRTVRRKFTSEFRSRAARLVIDTDRSIISVADEIGISAGLLGKWIKAERESSGVQVLDASERAELIRLRKEVRELQLDKEFQTSSSERGCQIFCVSRVHGVV